MDLHSNVVIIISNRNNEKHFNINFKEKISDIDFEKDVLEFKEYHSMKFKHNSSSSNEKLYFNGFDIILSDVLKEDESGEKYLSNDTLDVINYNNTNKNVLVPGYYLLTLINEKIKYAIIKIIPKDFNEEEWKLLYEDINIYLNGLADSFINQNNAKVIQNKKNINLRNKINFINTYYPSIVSSINQLIATPRQTMQKKYNWTLSHTQPPVDKNTFKYAAKYPNQKHNLYTYKRQINYNIPENKWIKSVLEFLLKELNTIEKVITLKLETENSINNSKYQHKTNEVEFKKINFIEIIKKISKIKNLIVKLKNTQWYESVSYKNHITPPQSALMNKNYNFFYKWYKEFNRSNLEFIFSEKIMNSWKKTDELYEIWCYINIIEILRSSGFLPSKGWIFNGDIQSDLLEGTYVTMNKENITLNIHYNSQLKYKSSETDIVNPLYTGNKKNKPDIRIDIFVGDIYLKSLPIDVKYRKLKNITDPKIGSLIQLLAYRDSPKSLLHLEGARDIRKNNHTVITKVIVLYPKDIQSNSKTKTLSLEHGLLFYEFGPNYINEALKATLNDEINEAFEIYNDIY